MNKRLLTGIAAAGIIGGGVYGFAATLGVTSTNLSAGGAGVSSCDADSIAAAYTVGYEPTHGYEVVTVELTDIAAACDAKELKVTLSAENNSALAERTVAVSQTSGAQSVNFGTASDVKAADVFGIDLVIEG